MDEWTVIKAKYFPVGFYQDSLCDLILYRAADFLSIAGQRLSVSTQDITINGIVKNFQAHGSVQRGWTYYIKLNSVFSALKTKKYTQSYRDIGLWELVKSNCEKYLDQDNYNLISYIPSWPVINTAVQYQESVWDFIIRLCQSYQIGFYIFLDNLIFVPLSQISQTKKTDVNTNLFPKLANLDKQNDLYFIQYYEDQFQNKVKAKLAMSHIAGHGEHWPLKNNSPCLVVGKTEQPIIIACLLGQAYQRDAIWRSQQDYYFRLHDNKLCLGLDKNNYILLDKKNATFKSQEDLLLISNNKAYLKSHDNIFFYSAAKIFYNIKNNWQLKAQNNIILSSQLSIIFNHQKIRFSSKCLFKLNMSHNTLWQIKNNLSLKSQKNILFKTEKDNIKINHHHGLYYANKLINYQDNLLITAKKIILSAKKITFRADSIEYL